jgi:hypothetical protein
MQPSDSDHLERNRHKLLVQSRFAPDDGDINQDTLVRTTTTSRSPWPSWLTF